jgi:uncharacterized protein YggE
MRCGKSSAFCAMAWMAATLASVCSATAQQPMDNRPKISVSGEAVVYVQPDKIVIGLGVETWAAQVDAAKQKNDAIVKKAIAAIQECGVEKNSIQTDSIAIEPIYKPYDGRWPYNYDIEGYCVRNSLTVTVNKVALVERLITSALQSGVNRVHNVAFQTTELRKHRDEARRLALKAAREKAQNMADVYDQAIGKPLQIVENSANGYYIPYWSGWRQSGRDYGMTQNTMVTTSSEPTGDDGETVALGKIGVRANVSVVFELKDK